jgi:hypothetical protein
MNMSPYPAGQAKIAGNTPRTCKITNVTPIILPDCANVKVRAFKPNANFRNDSEVAIHTANTTMGTPAAIPTAAPMRLA